MAVILQLLLDAISIIVYQSTAAIEYQGYLLISFQQTMAPDKNTHHYHFAPIQKPNTVAPSFDLNYYRRGEIEVYTELKLNTGDIICLVL